MTRIVAAIFAVSLCTLSAWYPARPAAAAPGDLDPTFGTGGVNVTDFFAECKVREGAALLHLGIQSDGKIVGSGVERPGGQLCPDLVRYTKDGALDTSFGGGGTGYRDIPGNNYQRGFAFAVQADDKILVSFGSTVATIPSLGRF